MSFFEHIEEVLHRPESVQHMRPQGVSRADLDDARQAVMPDRDYKFATGSAKASYEYTVLVIVNIMPCPPLERIDDRGRVGYGGTRRFAGG